MRSLVVGLCVVGFLSVVFMTKASTGPIPLNCNRACLENLVDQYLTALWPMIQSGCRCPRM